MDRSLDQGGHMVESNRQRRIVWLVVAVLALLVLAPGASAAPPSEDAKATCKGDGYLYVTTADGQPFRNAGQCMKYIREGGVVIQLPRLTIDFTRPIDDQFYINVSGRKLQPGARLYVETDLGSRIDIYAVDSTGNLAFTGEFYPCDVFAWFEYSTLDQDGRPISAREAAPC